MTPPGRTETSVTRLLAGARAGDRHALDAVFPRVYDELRVLARARLRHARGGATLNTTALVHEAFIKLTAGETPSWESRAHFFALSSRAMRFILVGHARERMAEKRGGGVPDVPIEAAYGVAVRDAGLEAEELLTLDGALDKLAAADRRLAEIVEMRFFGSMTYEEIAEVTGRSEATVKRDWRRARAWLYQAMQEDEPPAAGEGKPSAVADDSREPDSANDESETATGQ